MKPTVGAKIYRGTSRNLAMLAKKLQQGQLVAVPTETVYGLAGNALDPMACRRIFRAKGRPLTDPLIVHIHELTELEQLAVVNPVARDLAAKFWPGPLTLVLKKRPVVPDEVTAGQNSVAIRMPQNSLLRRLLKQSGLPLAAPSANPFGYVSPTEATHVRDGLGSRIHYILDGGRCRIGLESTIVDVRNPARIRLLRPGAISVDQLTKVLGQRIHRYGNGSRGNTHAQIAPGLLKRHYSPRVRVVLHHTVPAELIIQQGPGEAVLLWKRPGHPASPRVHWLDERGDARKAAKNLFRLLRRIDGKGYQTLHAELAPQGALAEAINDRLRRAAACD